MREHIRFLALVAAALCLLDIGVAVTLRLAESRNVAGSLVTYFDYGRSVPGKLQQWDERPNMPANLFDVAWRDEIVAASATDFAQAPQTTGPTVRVYGMSFTNNIFKQVADLAPDLQLDLHAGPSASPNFTFAVSEDDSANRQAGDIVVLGILSGAVQGLASMSNSTWVFEQPAPFTYPIYRPGAQGLQRTDPLITSATEQRRLQNDPALRQAWQAQLSAQDAHYSLAAFAAPILDHSPLMRLIRRALAIQQIEQKKQQVLSGGFPVAEVLNQMIVTFAAQISAQGQIPVVFLIQPGGPDEPDLLAMTRDTLAAHDILYLATQEHFDARDRTGLLPDGHYIPAVDRIFAQVFLDLIQTP